jgi:type II secretory pathway pseudopilin PulG
MTISIPPTKPARRRGFTLVEVMVSATLTTFILAGILSAFLFIGRTGFAASSYSELEAETRRALEIFGADARRATGIQWNSEQSITLSLATATNATTLATYAYDADADSPTYQCFYRLAGDPTSTLPRRVLVHHVAAGFAFQRYKLDQSGSNDNPATTDLETKEIQVTLSSSRSGVTAVTATQTALSARYILRNKRVSN